MSDDAIIAVIIGILIIPAFPCNSYLSTLWPADRVHANKRFTGTGPRLG